jgi:hypothetical protein
MCGRRRAPQAVQNYPDPSSAEEAWDVPWAGPQARSVGPSRRHPPAPPGGAGHAPHRPARGRRGGPGERRCRKPGPGPLCQKPTRAHSARSETRRSNASQVGHSE